MKIKKISLYNLKGEVLSATELHHVVGGVECGCGCNGSSHSSSMSANYAHTYHPGSSCDYTYNGEKQGCRGSTARRNVAFHFGPMYRIIKYLLLFLILTIGLSANSQRKDTDAKVALWNYKNCRERNCIGNANIRILYAFNAENMEDKDTWIDEGQLKICKNLVQYSSHLVEINEDSLANWLDKHPNSNVWPAIRWLRGYKPGHWIEYQHSQITTEDGILTEWATMPRELDTENLYYTENLPLFSWQIGTETATVCGYECIKATCHWRGRDFTAWFTPDIPAEYGPWKFGGLPGLIMKVSDDDGIYVFEAVAVENGNFPIYAPRGNKYAKSTREKVWKLQRALNENYLKTTGYSVFNIKLGREISSRDHPYSQLELE